MTNSIQKPDDPLSRFSLNIFRVYGLLMQVGDNVTKQAGQSSARWQVLGRAGQRPQTVAKMAREMGHARQSVQRVADVLEKEDLIVYVDNPSDRRAMLVQLTPKGEEVLQAIYSLYAAWSKQFMSKIDSQQLGEMADLLELIGDKLISVEPLTKERGPRNEKYF